MRVSEGDRRGAANRAERRGGERLSTRASRSWPPGSSRGYGPTDERPTDRIFIYLCIGFLGANVRICRSECDTCVALQVSGSGGWHFAACCWCDRTLREDS